MEKLGVIHRNLAHSSRHFCCACATAESRERHHFAKEGCLTREWRYNSHLHRVNNCGLQAGRAEMLVQPLPGHMSKLRSLVQSASGLLDLRELRKCKQLSMKLNRPPNLSSTLTQKTRDPPRLSPPPSFPPTSQTSHCHYCPHLRHRQPKNEPQEHDGLHHPPLP